VTGVFFLDSSALIKLYHHETGTERVEQLFSATGALLVISELTGVELYSALARRVRTGEITAEMEQAVVRNFHQDCSDRFIIEPLSSAVAQHAKDLLTKHAKQNALRSLDARQDAVFVCADDRLCRIASAEGFAVLNPEAGQP
jgi:predicted nucleic acid-binding protein